jgi:hypothetical protein
MFAASARYMQVQRTTMLLSSRASTAVNEVYDSNYEVDGRRHIAGWACSAGVVRLDQWREGLFLV